jgi:hypothetical protein
MDDSKTFDGDGIILHHSILCSVLILMPFGFIMAMMFIQIAGEEL